MSLVSDLDLPAFDYAAPNFPADKLPIIWSGSPAVSPGHGPGPDVT